MQAVVGQRAALLVVVALAAGAQEAGVQAGLRSLRQQVLALLTEVVTGGAAAAVVRSVIAVAHMAAAAVVAMQPVARKEMAVPGAAERSY